MFSRSRLPNLWLSKDEQKIVEENEQLFLEFIENINGPNAKQILEKLPKTPNNANTSFIELEIPNEWKRELTNRTMNKSVLIGETKSRVSTSDRIVQPNLVSNLGSPTKAKAVNWPGEGNSADQKTTVVEDQYTSVEIPFKYKMLKMEGFLDISSKPGFNEVLLEHMSSQLADLYDTDMVSLADDKDLIVSSILNSDQVIGHVSNGLSTVAGYYETHQYDNGDVWKKAYDDLPKGYKNRAKWIMNSNTASKVKELKLSDGTPLVNDSDKDENTGKLLSLFERPVLINEHMPDTGFIAILVDLTRGYISGKPRFNSLIIDLGTDTIGIRSQFAGQVLQPACYKVIKLDNHDND